MLSPMILNPYIAKLCNFEGCDGSGKSEQFRMARELLVGRTDVFFTKEPTDLPGGDEIYQILKGTHPVIKLEDIGHDGIQRLYFMDRVEQTRQRLIPNLSSGTHVLSDRGLLSSPAFGSFSEKDFERIFAIGSDVFIQAGMKLIWPDNIIIYDVPVQVAMDRLSKSGKVRDKFEQEEKLRVVIENYRRLAQRYPHCHLVDARGTPEEVFRETKKYLRGII